MIIGNGLLASGFYESIDLFDDCVIFASGVSNSKETREKEFNREKDLIMETLAKNQGLKFIYFSSILAGISNNDYYNHNSDMENLIKDNSENYLIFKLPQIIGESGNKNNLINYLIRAITNEEEITIYEDVSRSLLDVDDVVSIVYFCKNKTTNKTLNVSGIEKITVLDLCKKIGKILKKKPNIIKEVGNGYDEWALNNSPIVKKAIDNLDNPRGYTKKVLKKYMKW